VYFKLSTNNVRFSKNDGASPETFFPKLVQEIPANRIAWAQTARFEGHAEEMVDEAKAALSCLKQSDQDWIFAKTAQSLYPASRTSQGAYEHEHDKEALKLNVMLGDYRTRWR